MSVSVSNHMVRTAEVFTQKQLERQIQSTLVPSIILLTLR